VIFLNLVAKLIANGAPDRFCVSAGTAKSQKPRRFDHKITFFQR
jgi:hypothetical protein